MTRNYLSGSIKKGLEINTTARNHSRNILAVGDEYGRIRLYRYPCLKEDATNPLACAPLERLGK